MDLLLRVWAVILFLAGTPVFLGLSAIFIGMATVPPPTPEQAVSRYLLLYVAFALSGLLSASGCLLWAAARLAYPGRSRRPRNLSEGGGIEGPFRNAERQGR